MGIWFLASAFAFQVVGFVGKQLAIEDIGAGESGGLEALQIYMGGFEKIAYVCFGGALAT